MFKLNASPRPASMNGADRMAAAGARPRSMR